MKISPKAYALKALEVAKKDLSRDKHLIPVAFIVLDEDVLDFNLQFEDRHLRVRQVGVTLVRLRRGNDSGWLC